MGKVSAPKFAMARASALRALANVEHDTPVPDAIRFFDDGGFVIRISVDDNHSQRVVPWTQIDLTKFEVIKATVLLMLEALARADFET